LARLRGEHAELVRLRGQVAALRQQATGGQNAQDSLNQIERNKATKAAKLAGEAEQGQALLRKSPEIPMLPASSWTNSGFANPASALQTLNWAVRNQDTNAFASAMMWDAQTRAQADSLFSALPQSVQERFGSLDGLIFDWMLGRATPTASFRVLSQTEQGPDDMTVVEQHQYVDGRVRENSVPFHRDENGSWRQVIPPELMPKLEMVINDLAGAPPTVGK
jgi:hypothetical protein